MTCAPDVSMGVWVRPAKWVEWGAAAGTRWPARFCRVPRTPARANTGGPPAPCQAQGGGGGFRARSIELELELLGHLPPVTVEGAELEH